MWEEHVSKSKGVKFYYNRETGQSQWEPPTEGSIITSEIKSRVQARHILAKHKDSRRPSSWREENITRTKEEALNIIEGYIQQIKSGEKTFEAIAKEFSDCSSARNGGDLGFFSRGQMQKPFEEAAFNLQVNDISEPVFTDSGVHVIQRLA
ncbi:peptidyl-prolyl cis-trans isomerase NIMA-interacting 1 [Neoconidiobolus thromboides FSU 785]|nr:peptidyl-prolyl cis-trans isomerase NIMA-interacting 1 [Neoconidiobolus thromboides FSU 785]